MDIMLQDVTTSRDEAVSAHNEAQSKVVSLLSQVRTLRTSVDDVTAERDMLLTEKKTLETQKKKALEDKKAFKERNANDNAPNSEETLNRDSEMLHDEDDGQVSDGKEEETIQDDPAPNDLLPPQDDMHNTDRQARWPGSGSLHGRPADATARRVQRSDSTGHQAPGTKRRTKSECGKRPVHHAVRCKDIWRAWTLTVHAAMSWTIP